MESLPTDGTNDFLPGEGGDGSYSYSYSYGIVDFCTDDTGFLDCIGAALLSGEVTGDEVDAAFDAISGFEDDGWSADTCAEFQQEPNLAEQCGSWTLGVCDDEYKEWVAVWKFSASMAWRPIFDFHAGGSAASSPRSPLKFCRILIRSTARLTATP